MCVLVPIWFVHYPPLQDYWNHLLKARILADYSNPSLGYSQLYRLSFLPTPNAASTLVMAMLMKFFSPDISGKVFLSICAVALPLSTRYMVRCSRVGIKALEYIGFTVVYNPCFWQGFIDFCLSVAIAQFAIGYWVKTRDKVSPVVAAKYLLLVLLTYFTHLWGVVVLTGAVFILCLWETRSRKLLWLGAAAMIGVLFMVYSSGADERSAVEYRGLTFTLSILRNTIAFPRLLGPTDGAFQIGASTIMICTRLALFSLLAVLAWKRRTPLLYVSCGLVALYFALPAQLGRMYEPGQRTLLFLPALLAASVAVRPPRLHSAILQVLILSSGLVATAATLWVWMAKQPDLQNYYQALAAIPPHKRVLNVVTLKCPRLSGPGKLAGSDAYTAEKFFGAIYNIEKGGYYPGTFTTGMIKVRAKTPRMIPAGQTADVIDWPKYIAANHDELTRHVDYVVVVGPSSGVGGILRRTYSSTRQAHNVVIFGPMPVP